MTRPTPRVLGTSADPNIIFTTRHFNRCKTRMSERSLSKRCVQRFVAILSSTLGQEVEKYMRKLPELDGVRWGFTPILEDFKRGSFQSPVEMLDFLKSQTRHMCQLIGEGTPASLCIQTVALDIANAISPLLPTDQPDKADSIKALRHFASSVIDQLPDNLAEFREVLRRQRLAVPSLVENCQAVDDSQVPIQEVDVLLRRCKAITDDETHAEVGELIRRYEPDVTSGSDGETMEVDLARSSTLTLRKLAEFLDLRDVPEVSAETDKRARTAKTQNSDEAEEEEEEEDKADSDEEDDEWTKRRPRRHA